MQFEYKVVPAPTRGKKAKGLKSPAERFANALSEAMNAQAADGWEYLRTDTLPAEERTGLTGRSTVFQNMLVFRRAADADSKTGKSPAEAADPAESGAPKLPSAEAAQKVPDSSAPAPAAMTDSGDLAAE